MREKQNVVMIWRRVWSICDGRSTVFVSLMMIFRVFSSHSLFIPPTPPLPFPPLLYCAYDRKTISGSHQFCLCLEAESNRGVTDSDSTEVKKTLKKDLESRSRNSWRRSVCWHSDATSEIRDIIISVGWLWWSLPSDTFSTV